MKTLKRLLLTSATAISLMGTASAATPAWSEQDIWKVYEDFNNTFVDSRRNIYMADNVQPGARHRGNGFRDGNLSGCAAAIWCQAPYFDMAINAARLAEKSMVLTDGQKAAYSDWVKRLYNGEKAHYVNFNFDDNNINNGWFIYDDIMWWTIALAHAYEYDPSFSDYLSYAEESFCRVWYGSKKVGDTGSYSNPEIKGQTGGMYWQWQPIRHPKPNGGRDYKSACINFPSVIAMAKLAQLVPEDRTAPTEEYPTCQTREFYKEKAIEIYAWAKQHLVPGNSGRVADGMHGRGPEYSDHLYNQATYIGASCLLYKITGEAQYLENARQAVSYTKNKMSHKQRKVQVLPYEYGYEQGIYCAIFAQYMDMFINELGQGDHDNCEEWLRQNIIMGLANRDSRGLNDGRFAMKTIDGSIIESYGASALPSLMLVISAE